LSGAGRRVGVPLSALCRLFACSIIKLACLMSLKPLIILPDPVLRRRSEPVAEVNAELTTLIEDMLETMYEAPGIGLAAIQVGVPLRLLVLDIAGKEEPKQPRVFINPEIVWQSPAMSRYEEGCLSIPGYYAEVERPAAIRAAYRDRSGKKQEIKAEGLLATCLQHEIDHLNGVLFIDHISKLKRDMVMRKFKKKQKL